MPAGSIIADGISLVDECQDHGITTRIMGAIAVKIHTRQFAHLHKEREITDIDLVTYTRHEREIQALLAKQGYKPLTRSPFVTGGRQIYEGNHHVDVFLNALEMCHTINFKGRLELDYPTITVTDVLLEKMQIVQIDEKDLKDSAVLMREHDVTEKHSKETVSSGYISELLSNDWGFYHTVTTNLNRLEDFSSSYLSSPEDFAIVKNRIHSLLNRIDAEPKSMGWKVRARVGTRRKWYRDVGEVIR